MACCVISGVLSSSTRTGLWLAGRPVKPLSSTVETRRSVAAVPSRAVADVGWLAAADAEVGGTAQVGSLAAAYQATPRPELVAVGTVATRVALRLRGQPPPAPRLTVLVVLAVAIRYSLPEKGAISYGEALARPGCVISSEPYAEGLLRAAATAVPSASAPTGTELAAPCGTTIPAGFQEAAPEWSSGGSTPLRVARKATPSAAVAA